MQQFINNVQGNPKSVKSISFSTGFDQTFCEYFEQNSLIVNHFMYFIHANTALKWAVEGRASPLPHKYI